MNQHLKLPTEFVSPHNQQFNTFILKETVWHEPRFVAALFRFQPVFVYHRETEKSEFCSCKQKELLMFEQQVYLLWLHSEIKSCQHPPNKPGIFCDYVVCLHLPLLMSRRDKWGVRSASVLICPGTNFSHFSPPPQQ